MLSSFSEKTRSPIWVKILSLTIFLVIISSFLPAIAGSIILIPFMLIGIFISFGVFFSSTFVTISKQSVKIGLFPFGFRNFDYTMIRSVEVMHEVKVSRFQGGGWKRDSVFSGAFLWKSGPAIIIHLTNGKSYLYQSDRAAEAVGLMRHYIENRLPDMTSG